MQDLQVSHGHGLSKLSGTEDMSGTKNPTMLLEVPKKRKGLIYGIRCSGDSLFEMIRIPGPPSPPGRDAEHFLWEGQSVELVCFHGEFCN